MIANATPEISPPPPTGTTTGVDLGKLFEQLEADRPLSGDDVFIVEGVDEGIVFLIPQLKRPLVRVVVHPPDQLDLAPYFFVASTLRSGRRRAGR